MNRNLSTFATVTAILACLVTGSRAYSDVTLLIPGASQEESDECVEAFLASTKDQTKALLIYGKILKQHPRNRAARINRAGLLLRMGVVKASRDDIIYLQKHAPEFPGILEVLAEIYQAKGQRQKAAEILEKTLVARSDDPAKAERHRFGNRFLELRIKELRGQMKETEALWARTLSESTPRRKRSVTAAMGAFYLRQGLARKATQYLQTTFNAARKEGASPDIVAGIADDLVAALWLDGKLAQALSVAKELTKDIPPNRWPMSEGFMKLVLSQLVLAELLDNEEESENAGAIVKSLADRVSVGRPYSVEAILAVFTGKSQVRQVAQRLRRILKAAPELEWAKWAALYMGLSEPGHAKDLLKLLPEKSLQRRIAEIEQKAAGTTQRTTRPSI